MLNNKIKSCTITQQITCRIRFACITPGCAFLTGIHTVQEWLNLFDMTRGAAERSGETSITGEAFTAVVMTIAMGESQDPTPHPFPSPEIC